MTAAAIAGRAALCAVAGAAVACTGDGDPPWQLDHDRIVAVRATPPQLAAGEQAVIDALIARRGEPVAERSPDTASVESPLDLADTLGHDATRWTVTAPSADALAAARSELGLAAGAAIPLVLRVSYAGGALVATKTVWLGAAASNPAITGVEIDHAAAAPSELTVAPDQDISLSVGIDDPRDDINWLSSCGTVHDFDLPDAYLRIETGDAVSGQLVLVVRDRTGGVSWQVWPIRADQDQGLAN